MPPLFVLVREYWPPGDGQHGKVHSDHRAQKFGIDQRLPPSLRQSQEGYGKATAADGIPLAVRA